MSLWTKMLLIGGGIGGIALYRRRRTDAGIGADGDQGFVPTSSVRDMAVASGISNVDPEPLSQMVEAQDPDATAAAHDIGRMRDRLPR